MVKVRVNFSEVTEFEAIPSGVYECVLTSIEQVKPRSAESEHDMIVWGFTIAGGPFDNKKLRMNTSLAPKALWKLFQVLRSFGVNVSKKDQEQAFELDPLVGTRVKAVVVEKSYQGSPRNDITDIKVIGAVVGTNKTPHPKRR